MAASVRAVCAARQRAEAAGASLTLAGVPANTLRNLSIVGLDQVFATDPAAVPHDIHVITASTQRPVHG
ncbi:hypothetical protein [Streptomyces fagopyri]|uniref:hypothetical protein n=1 Tax=Streptomyces fagopyri TaxID=2662397 RepID=UPI00371F2125